MNDSEREQHNHNHNRKLLEATLIGPSSTSTVFSWTELPTHTVLLVSFIDSHEFSSFSFSEYKTDRNGDIFYICTGANGFIILKKGHKISELVDWLRNEMKPNVG